VALFVRVMAEVWRKLFVETVERLVVMVSLFVWVEVSVGVCIVCEGGCGGVGGGLRRSMGWCVDC
jgi:hypothetical protein